MGKLRSKDEVNFFYKYRHYPYLKAKSIHCNKNGQRTDCKLDPAWMQKSLAPDVFFDKKNCVKQIKMFFFCKKYFKICPLFYFKYVVVHNKWSFYWSLYDKFFRVSELFSKLKDLLVIIVTSVWCQELHARCAALNFMKAAGIRCKTIVSQGNKSSSLSLFN